MLWFKFGRLLHGIVNSVIRGAYFLAITPMAILMRPFGKKLLNHQCDPHAASYWIERIPPGPRAESVRHQF
jgi:hypothetical protein